MILFTDLFPKKVEELLSLMAMQAEEIYQTVVDSLSGVVHSWDNVAEDFTTPCFFKKHYSPFYQKVGRFPLHGVNANLKVYQ